MDMCYDDLNGSSLVYKHRPSLCIPLSCPCPLLCSVILSCIFCLFI